MTFFAELVWRNYKNRRRVVVHGLLPVYFQHLLDHFKVLSHRMTCHFRTPGDGTVICLVWVELHVLLDLLCFTQHVAGDVLHKQLEGPFAVAQLGLVASHARQLLVQRLLYYLLKLLLADSLVVAIQMDTVRWTTSSYIYHFLLN